MSNSIIMAIHQKYPQAMGLVVMCIHTVLATTIHTLFIFCVSGWHCMYMNIYYMLELKKVHRHFYQK